MNIKYYSVKEKLDLAFTTTDPQELNCLMCDVSAEVRRMVAKNKACPTDILNTLSFDPVTNVCYAAKTNPNCTVKRMLEDENHPCVKCEIDERYRNCFTCDKLINSL